MAEQLSEQQLFDRDGYLIVRGLFSPEEVQEMINACVDLENRRPVPGSDKEMMYYEDSLTQPGARILSRIEKFTETCEIFKRISEDPRITERVARCLSWGRSFPYNPTPVLFKEKVNFKKGNGGNGFAPHQDIQPGWDDYCSYFISVLVTIDPSTLENGCLELSSGHHKRGLIGEKWKPLTEEQLKGIHFTKFPTAPGDVVFFDCFVPHQSEPNMTPNMRRNLYLTYNHASEGDFRLKYYEDKRKAFPPDNEREGKQYAYKV